MNNTWTFILIAFIFVGCNQAPKLTFTLETFTEQQLAICNDEPCSSVEISYPIFSGDEKISEKINKELTTFIAQMLFLGDEPDATATPIAAAAKDFILAYRDHQADVPSDIDMGAYKAEINTSISHQNANILSVQSDSYIFTGGAHGNSYVNFHNFDLEKGNLLDIEDLVSNFEAFQDFVEIQFRKDQKISENGSINATGLWFENDTFYVSNNIGFSSENFIMIYNRYEIAPYAEGEIIFNLPINEIRPYLKDEFIN